MLFLRLEAEAGKCLEDLLQGSLAYAVVVDAELLCELIHHAKHLPNTPIFTRHSQSHIVPVLFEQVRLPKVAAYGPNCAETVAGDQ
jgi:hypothetical protein